MRISLIKERKTDESIMLLIKLFAYSTIPPLALVIGIFVAVTLIGNKESLGPCITFFTQSIPLMLTYAIIPMLLFIKVEKKNLRDMRFSMGEHRRLLIINGIVSILFIAFELYKNEFSLISIVLLIHFMVVAISEEILARGIILYECEELFERKGVAVIVSALIFAFIFHSESGFLSNLLVRVPFAIIMTLIAKKTDSIIPAITVHWIYNILLTL